MTAWSQLKKSIDDGRVFFILLTLIFGLLGGWFISRVSYYAWNMPAKTGALMFFIMGMLFMITIEYTGKGL